MTLYCKTLAQKVKKALQDNKIQKIKSLDELPNLMYEEEVAKFDLQTNKQLMGNQSSTVINSTRSKKSLFNQLNETKPLSVNSKPKSNVPKLRPLSDKQFSTSSYLSQFNSAPHLTNIPEHHTSLQNEKIKRILQENKIRIKRIKIKDEQLKKMVILEHDNKKVIEEIRSQRIKELQDIRRKQAEERIIIK